MRVHYLISPAVANFGLNKKWRDGTQSRLVFNNQRLETNSTFQSLNPQFTSNLIAQMTRPQLMVSTYSYVAQTRYSWVGLALPLGGGARAVGISERWAPDEAVFAAGFATFTERYALEELATTADIRRALVLTAKQLLGASKAGVTTEVPDLEASAVACVGTREGRRRAGEKRRSDQCRGEQALHGATPRGRPGWTAI